ncbi:MULTISPECIES: hypothetical protein [Flavobacterium]|nr:MULTISPECIES: hypothetical protein [Flavobacterium]OXA73363.1 hypothetical protein B0A56_13345 [Flavobacterium columnare NBRC 100251 = ATCC 23463]AMA49867.1 hypothetical protein AWN65_10585 [Flavobacterium covae]AND64604.1 hypothetical protein AX766_09330 [Flavobacterium covae]MCJ1810217.1 hypothetical protein [Flavobacterium covae]OWP80115.1 hypothetical protein BWK63_12765 [Flavobacterium covae]
MLSRSERSGFLNKHPQFARGFVGHKQDPLYKAEDYELLTPESIEEIPLDNNLITTINEWLKYSKEDANRRNYFKMGKDFENYIISKLSSPESLEYKALEQKIPDLSERSIYTQVYFCINGDQTGNCTNEGDYFIADFVFVKEIQVGNTSILDARIEDTKLSVNTDFTKNQKAAMNLSKYYIRSIPTESRSNPIKGNPLPNFQKGASVSKSGSFIKIYSGGSATSFGGVK